MIADLFPENKYPSEESFCETARQVLTQSSVGFQNLRVSQPCESQKVSP